MRVKRMAAFLVFLAAAGLPLYAGNIVANPGFETGDFTGWTTGGNFEFTQVVSGAFYLYSGAQEGSYYATLGAIGSDGTLSQTLSDITGIPYTFTFWLAGAGDDPSDFSAYWNSDPVLSLTDPDTAGVWTQYSFTETGTGSDTILFSFRDDPAWMALDNVSVDSTSAVPEPASFSLLAGGLLLFAFRRRRCRQSGFTPTPNARPVRQ
jgi:PEP-CTERM motif